MRPNKHKSGRKFLAALQRQKKQLRLVAHLLEGVQFVRRLRQPDKTLRAKNRRRQRAKKLLERPALDRSRQRQEKRGSGVRQMIVVMMLVPMLMIVVMVVVMIMPAIALIVVMMMRMDRHARARIAEHAGIDLALLREDDPRGRIELAQADLHALLRGGIERICSSCTARPRHEQG
jgi:hypothetical protein